VRMARSVTSAAIPPGQKRRAGQHRTHHQKIGLRLTWPQKCSSSASKYAQRPQIWTNGFVSKDGLEPIACADVLSVDLMAGQSQ